MTDTALLPDIDAFDVPVVKAHLVCLDCWPDPEPGTPAVCGSRIMLGTPSRPTTPHCPQCVETTRCPDCYGRLL